MDKERRMYYLYKTILTKSSPHLYELILQLQRSHHTCLKALRCRMELFLNAFLPFTVNEWNKLTSDIRKCFFCNFPQKAFLLL